MDGEVERRSSTRSPFVVEVLKTVFYAFLIAAFIRTFLFQPFNIPSGSMENTLLVGDYLFVSKFAYGYSNHSLPWSPDLFKGRVWSAPPERGDVVVFRLPVRPWEDYIKRVVGLPGDRVQMIDGVLHINGEPCKMERVEDYVAPQWPGNRVPQQMHLDVVVDDLDTAEAGVLALGATKADEQPGTTFRVFLDLAGHPFCLCLS